ncbi:MAG TPA: AAA family ATPase, partial [Candidatus Limnocylindria bacterium]|nr:AAA family ATPase [Candidatus Limnocylindria bacterium]
MPTQIFGGTHDGGVVTSDARIAVGPAADVPPLLERESELHAIGERLSALRDGTGSVLLIDGEAGIGKSSLLRQALRAARHARLDVLVARGGELERNYPFGLVLDLFGPVLRDERDRNELLRGPADLARPLFETARAAHNGSASDPFPTLHGLFWLTVNVAERGPLVLIVDDAHWADDASLAYLYYLAQRIDQVAVMLVVAFRPGEAAASESQPLLSSGAQRLRPAPLSPDAIAELAAAHGADDTADVAQRTWEATRGNPFFATELLRNDAALVATAPATAAVPDAVSRAIVARLGRLGSAARRVAEAGAVLEEHATLDQVADLADVDAAEAAEAVRALVNADILDAEQGLAFVHPIVREAVYAAMPGALRARLHRRAAKLLQQASAPVEAQAIHLLASEPAADADVVAALCQAAAAARAGGATELAVTYLRRALREPPGDEAIRASVLLDLARADAALGSELTDTRYREA